MTDRTRMIQRLALRGTIFYTGAVILAIEVMAVRILSPYFGNTIYNFSSVLSVILAALALGYWFGGRVADRYPKAYIFYALVSICGVFVLIMQGLSHFLLPTLGQSLGVVIGPLVASIAFFFVPGCLFGLLSPFVVKLAAEYEPHKGIGTIAGEVFFFSTIGSIVGSLVSGFVLIPLVSMGVSMSLMGWSLIALGIIGAWRTLPKKTMIVFVAACISFGLSANIVFALSPPYVEGTILYDADGVYGRIVILEGEYLFRHMRILRFDHSLSSAVFMDDPSRLPFPYMNFVFVYKHYIPEPTRVVALGSAMNAVPKMILQSHPRTIIDAVDIEPSFPELARTYFGVPDDPRLINHTADGRRFLHATDDGVYDVIIGDAFHSFYSIPWHMTTQEFYKEAYRTLSPHGLYLMNVISMNDADGPTMLYSSVATMETVFDDVAVIAVSDPLSRDPQNFIVIGSKGFDLSTLQQDLLGASKPFLTTIVPHVMPMAVFEGNTARVLTDAYAPTDAFTARLLVKSSMQPH